MTTNRRENDLRVEGMSLRGVFVSSTTIPLVVVMSIAAFLLIQSVTSVAKSADEQRIVDSIALTAREGSPSNFEQEGGSATQMGKSIVRRFPIVYGLKRGERKPANYYEGRISPESPVARLLVPPDTGRTGRGLLGLIIGISTMVVAVGAAVSVIMARRISTPIEALAVDVSKIARGNLTSRIQAKGAREVAMLGKAIDRMAMSLGEAQQAELELSARERELEVADEVRESLLPEGTPDIPGYDLGVLQIGCATPGGDFYDILEYEDGRVGLLVCEVSGQGIPGALVAATARAYLRAILLRSPDVSEGLRKVNQYLAQAVRRGMYVTAICVLLDPESGKAEVACAGHKVPLQRFVAKDRKLRTMQPEGIALGFDKGAIFDRALTTAELTIEEGDLLLLSNTGPLLIRNEDGDELGEKAFYRLVMQRATLPAEKFLDSLEDAFDEFADEEEFPADISIITLRRES